MVVTFRGTPMSRSHSCRSRRVFRIGRKTPVRSKPTLELLEDRLAPAGNLLVTTAGSYPQQFFKEYTPSGSLVRTVTVPPPPGSSGDTARDLVQGSGGNVYVYNGTFTPALATYNPGTSAWSQQPYSGWSTVNNTSYGGLGLYQNYVFASDMTVAGDPAGQSNGVVRFNLTNGTATRFANGIDTIDVNVGLDGYVYALAGTTVTVYDPNTLALIRSVTLPSGNDYRGVAANAAGDIFTANWGNTVTRFTSAGSLLSTVTLTGPNDGSWFNNPTDIDVASDGTVAVGTRSGHVVQMTSAFTNVTYFGTWTGSVQYACFVSFAAVSSPPQPTVNVADFSAAEGNSGTATFQVPVTLSAPSAQTVTITYSLSNGTATAGSDYVAASGQTLTFAPGQTTAYIPVTVYGDTTCEMDETISVQATGATNAIIGRGTGTATILTDDLPAITVNNTYMTEGNSGTVQRGFLVWLSGPYSQTVTVSYATADGTATAGSDYAAASGTVTFVPGQTSQTVYVPVYGDTTDEPDETFFFNVSNPVNATLAIAQGVGTIQNDDLTLSVSDAASVTEGNSGSTAATFTVTLSAASSHSVTVSYSTSNATATAGSDYTSASGTLTFNPGQTSITVPVSVLGDTLYEGNETFNLNLSLPVNATINRGTGTATIIDDDQPTLTVSDASVAEGNSGLTAMTFTVALSPASTQTVTVNYSTAAGTATAGSDYQTTSGTLTFAPGQTSKTVTVNVYGDTAVEANETFTLNLSGVTGNATIGRSQATGTIVNDDVPTITILNQGIYEGSSGSATANFAVYLSAASPQTVTVNYATADGTATAGSDYAVGSGTLTFTPGQTSATIGVPVYGDTVDEADELYYVNLSNAVNATLANTQGRGTIYNDDLSISVSDAAPVTEGNSGSTPAYFTVSLSAASTHTVTVGYYTNGGTATAGSDYISTSGTLTFNPGQTSITVPVSVLGDTLYEGNETFGLWITQASNALINRITGNATIVDDDPSTTISVSDASATEGNSGLSGVTFTVTLNAASTQTVTVNYSTAAGTATAGTDYQSLSGTLSFAPGQTSKTVTVYAIGDTAIEPNETFTLNLSGATNASISRAQGTGTILDDDSPGLSVGNASVIEGNGGTNYVSFNVTLSPSAAQTVTVSYATASGTATSGSDFTATSGTLTFYAGQTSNTIYVPVTGDLNYETDETFTLNLSNAVNATIRSGTGTGTILNDDGIPSLSVTDITNGEGNYATSTGYAYVSLSASSYQPITFTYSTANGTALAGVDYAASSGTLTINPGQTGLSFPITLYGDTTPEPTKAFYVNVSSVTNATLARPQGTVTIANDDGPTVSIYGNSITEGNSGTQLLTFTVQLSAPATQTTTVDYATSDGSTTAGSDYQATSGTLTFNPGEMTKYVSVVVYGDTTYEQNDFFYMRLSNAAYCVIGGTNYQATAYINNDDAAPTLSVNDVSVVEGNSGTVNAVFTVSLSAVSGLPATTYYQTVAGTATSGTDYYSISGGYIYIPVGQTSATVSVTVRGDTTIEADETFVLNLYSPGSATLGRANGTGTIVNDDFPVVSAAAASVVEGNSGATPLTFTLSLSAATPQTVTVNYSTADITGPVGGGGQPPAATAGVDYQAASGTVTFAPGQTTATVTVLVYGDNAVEQDEQFGLVLSNPVKATLSALPGNYGTIVNDDVPAVSVGDATATEGNSGTTALTFTVSLDQPGFSAVTVHFASADGTATAGTDYQAVSGDLTFAAGQTQKTVTVFVNGDTLSEADEAFFVNLSSPTNATLARSQATGTILNDDHAPVAVAGTDQTVGEGTVVSFDGSGSSDADGDTLTYTWTFGDGDSATGVSPTHTYADNGTFNVTLTVSDGVNSSTSSLTATVQNVAPMAGVTGDSGGVSGQERSFTFTASDPSAVDQAGAFTYQINWGDGSTQTVSGPASGVTVAHVFTATGSYTVTANATDKDGGTSEDASQSISIVVAELQGGDLVVGGSTGDDAITIQPIDENGTLGVALNGVDQGSFVPTGRVIVFGQAGNDVIQVVSVGLPVVLLGGDGDDTLDASTVSGPTVLSGGAGNDILYGGTGRNVLLGGTGADVLHGGGDDDLLVGGATNHDADPAFLFDLLAEWRRGDADYETRLGHLDGSLTGGLNGASLLNGQTVTDDAAIDSLFGNGGRDWFFAATNGANADLVNDLEAGEVVTPL
jgi:hypothetical protein